MFSVSPISVMRRCRSILFLGRYALLLDSTYTNTYDGGRADFPCHRNGRASSPHMSPSTELSLNRLGCHPRSPSPPRLRLGLCHLMSTSPGKPPHVDTGYKHNYFEINLPCMLYLPLPQPNPESYQHISWAELKFGRTLPYLFTLRWIRSKIWIPSHAPASTENRFNTIMFT